MKYNMSIIWDQAPESGTLEIVEGEFLGMVIMVGEGRWDGATFHFSNDGPCHVPFAIETDESAGKGETVIKVVQTAQPFDVRLSDVIKTGSLEVKKLGVRVTAEEDVWASL